jgi:hypothetical protein
MMDSEEISRSGCRSRRDADAMRGGRHVAKSSERDQIERDDPVHFFHCNGTATATRVLKVGHAHVGSADGERHTKRRTRSTIETTSRTTEDARSIALHFTHAHAQLSLVYYSHSHYSTRNSCPLIWSFIEPEPNRVELEGRPDVVDDSD